MPLQLTILWDAISRQLQQTALVNQGRRRLTINNGIYHRQPYGAWASPELDSPPHAAPLRLHLALFAGDSDINGNFIYLQDPRPQGGSVWPFWYRMGVSHAWERRAGSWLLYPAHVPRYTLPNADALPRMWIELQLDVIEGLNRGVADDASASQSERPRPQSAPPLEYAAVSVSHFSVSPELRAACLAEAYALFNHGGAGELKSNKVRIAAERWSTSLEHRFTFSAKAKLFTMPHDPQFGPREDGSRVCRRSTRKTVSLVFSTFAPRCIGPLLAILQRGMRRGWPRKPETHQREPLT